MMEQICRTLKPFANIYTVLLMWFLTITNFYICLKPIHDYAAIAGLKSMPVILDALFYYTPDEGYQTLSILGIDGRNAYRLTNYYDFVLPIILFLSLTLPNIALGEKCYCLIAPFIYMISDYIENLAEKYVLEIYPERNDSMMTLACYAGLSKFGFLFLSVLIIIINLFKWILKEKPQSTSNNKKKQK
ncbi:hypothetical protein I4U23_005786 [Adineta vaga]|nr:hypothetical protein I4U23_005786 [Adineta vaga]